MHFRHLLITGLMVGAAMFLPDNAFAEKNELSGQQNSQKASEQANPSIGIDNAVVEPNVPVKEKAVVVPEPAMRNQSEVKQNPTPVPPASPAAQKPVVVPQKPAAVSQKPVTAPQKSVAVSQKPVAASPNLPDQAKGKGPSALNKAKKDVQVSGSEKAAAAQEKNNGLGKNTPTPKSEDENSALDSLHNSKTEVKNHVQSVRVEPQREDTHLSMAKNESRSESLVQEPQQKGDIPLGEEEIPKASQVPNPTQQTSGHGGQSNDRFSQGLNTISFLDKWLVWNSYSEIQLVQSYHSRQAWLNNQWMNAPPSPPPQAAPLLETVTRS